MRQVSRRRYIFEPVPVTLGRYLAVRGWPHWGEGLEIKDESLFTGGKEHLSCAPSHRQVPAIARPGGLPQALGHCDWYGIVFCRE